MAPTVATMSTDHELMLPPFTQEAPQTPKRGIHRKKTAPAILQHDTDPQSPHQLRHNTHFETARPMDANAHQQYQQAPRTETIEDDHTDAQNPNMNFSVSFMMPANNNGASRRAVTQQTVDQSGKGPRNARRSVISATVPMAPAAHQQVVVSSSPERAVPTADLDIQTPRASQAHPKQQSSISLPFPEIAAPLARRNSPHLANRPLTSSAVHVNPVIAPRHVASTGRVAKRKKSAVGIPTSGRAETSNRTPDTQSPGHRIDSIQEQYTAGAGQPSAAVAEERNDAARPSPVTSHSFVPARVASNTSMSAFKILDQAKNMMTAQVLEKDRELAHLKAEVRRLAQAVQSLEENVGKLEGEKAILRDIMHKKCEGLKERVGELLKDHKAVGGFIQKTNTEIAKFNKYKEKSGSIFKEAITKYADLQKHQKNVMEAIHDTRIQVALDVADLTKAHNHESGIVVKDLQAEKKKVFELEKAIAAEKQKVMHLETRLDAGLGQSLTTMLEKQNETIAAKVENQGKKLLVAIYAKQEEKAASLKDYLKTLQAYKEHETEASRSIRELLSLVTALSAKVSEALQSKDAAHHGLQKAGAEVLNSIKEKVESISEAQGNQAELTNRVLHLETAKVNLESQLKFEERAKSDLRRQLEAKVLELEQTREDIQLKNQELKALQASTRQEAARSHQEADDLRSSIATLSEELKELREFDAKLQDDHQSLQARNSLLVDEGRTATEQLRRSNESTKQTAERLKASADENARLLRRAEAAETKIAELQAKLTEQAASTKQQLEAERVKSDQDKRRAVTTAQQGTLSELSTLKKRYEKLAVENSSLKDAAAAQSGTDDLEAEIARLEKENSNLIKSHVWDIRQYQKAFNSQGQQIESIKTQLAQSRQVPSQITEMEGFKGKFETAVARMESRLVHHENIEMKIRAYCEQHNWDYEEMDVENFLYQITTNAVEEYRKSLNSSSFSTQFSRPSMSFGQSMTTAATIGSAAQYSQSLATRRCEERTTEVVQVPGTQTPQKSRRSPSVPSVASRSPHVAMVSPPRARRNHSIAERRRILASSSKPPTPDNSGTPVRKPTDRTTGSGGRGHRAIPAPKANSIFDIPDSSEEASQKRGVATSKAGRGPVPQSTTPARPACDGNGKLDSDFSDLTDLMDMMDENPEADVIPTLEQQRLARASSIVEESQSQRSKAGTMEPPSTPREPSGSQAQDPKPLKSILKKRSHSISQEAEEIVALAPPRRQIQPPKGKNSLASLGTGVVGFRSSPEAGPSRTAGSQAKEQSAAESSTAAAQFDTSRPANTRTPRVRRTKTFRGFGTDPEVQSTPVAKKPRMSIPYKSGSQKK